MSRVNAAVCGEMGRGFLSHLKIKTPFRFTDGVITHIYRQQNGPPWPYSYEQSRDVIRPVTSDRVRTDCVSCSETHLWSVEEEGSIKNVLALCPKN